MHRFITLLIAVFNSYTSISQIMVFNKKIVFEEQNKWCIQKPSIEQEKIMSGNLVDDSRINVIQMVFNPSGSVSDFNPFRAVFENNGLLNITWRLNSNNEFIRNFNEGNEIFKISIRDYWDSMYNLKLQRSLHQFTKSGTQLVNPFKYKTIYTNIDNGPDYIIISSVTEASFKYPYNKENKGVFINQTYSIWTKEYSGVISFLANKHIKNYNKACLQIIQKLPISKKPEFTNPQNTYYQTNGILDHLPVGLLLNKSKILNKEYAKHPSQKPLFYITHSSYNSVNYFNLNIREFTAMHEALKQESGPTAEIGKVLTDAFLVSLGQRPFLRSYHKKPNFRLSAFPNVEVSQFNYKHRGNSKGMTSMNFLIHVKNKIFYVRSMFYSEKEKEGIYLTREIIENLHL